jgi:hypothetical protein
MKRRNLRKAGVLEWVFGSIATTDGTITNQRIPLGLRDDEVAEIHKVDSYIETTLPPGADDVIDIAMMLSMDPDVNDDPALAVSHEDLEVFYEHYQRISRDITTTGQSQGPENDKKTSDFNVHPVIVGTDVGMVFHGDASAICEANVRLYFTRRRATVQELNEILLKRR